MSNTKINTSNFIDISEHPNCWYWMKETSRQDTDGFSRLIGDNSSRFHRLFGKPNWKSNIKEGWTEGWAISEAGLNWAILTGSKGTIFKINLSISEEEFKTNNKIGLGITNYLQKLIIELMGEV